MASHEGEVGPTEYSASMKEVSTRMLSHNTTRVLRELELGSPILVTRHNEIIAALIPASMTDIVSRWFEGQTSSVRALFDSFKAPNRAPSGPEVLGDLAEDVTSAETAAPRQFNVTEVGVRRLSQSTSSILRAIETGQVVLIRRHSSVVGVIVPLNLNDVLSGRLDRDSELAENMTQVIKDESQRASGLTRTDFLAEVQDHIRQGRSA